MNRRTRKKVVALTGIVACGATPGWSQVFIQWQRIDEGLGLDADPQVVAVAVGGTEPQIAYAVVDGRGLYRSEDAGDSWNEVRGDAPCLARPGALGVSPADGQHVFLGDTAAGGGLWFSSDGGKTWNRCAGLADEEAASVTVPPPPLSLVWVGHRASRFLSVSADGGRTWSARDIGTVVPDARVFAVDETRWLVASTSRSLMRWTDDAGRSWHRPSGDTDYFAGPLPVMHVAERFFSAKHHGLNKSVDGGKTWKFAMGPHVRVVGTAGDLLFREGERTGLRGTKDRILNLEMSLDFGATWRPANFGLLEAIPEARRGYVTVSTEKDPYAHVRLATAWAAAPDGRTVFLSLGKAGLYRGRVRGGGRGPLLLKVELDPPAMPAGDSRARITLRAVVTSREGLVTKVVADLGALGQGELELHDDGHHGDGEAGDKTYGAQFRVDASVSAGPKTLGVIAYDDRGGMSAGSAVLTLSPRDARLTVWDGEAFARGLAWTGPPSPLNFIKPQTDEAYSGRVALEFRGEGAGWIGGGWNWHGWYPEKAGDDIRPYANLVFRIKIVGDDPGGLTVALVSSLTKKPTGAVPVAEYAGDGVNLRDGQWHEVVIPLRDLMTTGKDPFDPSRVWELSLNSWAPKRRAFSVFLDDIGFDTRPVRSLLEWVTLPAEREAPGLRNPKEVSADVKLDAEGIPVSPWIYGAAMGDRKLAVEMGLTALRAGGNPVTPLNWKQGFTSKGSDWFFQNEGTETPPERNWLLTFHGKNREVGLETYLTLPMMGRVAKDGDSVAFDIRKYPDQESWAGQLQPTDRLPHAGNGRQYVRGPNGEFLTNQSGQRVVRLIEPDPDTTSVPMSAEEQTAALRFMIERLGYGTAEQGGVRFLALDNEPMLWHTTHRGMRPQPCGYDELWERTRTYAALYKKIDPSVRIAGPCLWGWTAYFYSAVDAQAASEGKASWEDPPDFVAHGREPLTRWWLRQVAAYEKEHGVRLVDILDWHFYPQTGIYMGGTPNDPNVMEARVQATRVLWDPEFVDPSWMARDPNGRKLGGRLRILRLMKEWIAECCPGLQTALGEYSFGGEKDVSGGVAQVELLGVFAREGLDHAYYWFFPPANSPPYFAFKLLRNPDGKFTAVGDRYLPTRLSAPEDVSVHAYRDRHSGRVSFVLVNKRARQDSRVTLQFSRPVREQEVISYEYSGRDRFAIGRLPPRRGGGRSLAVDLPAMSAVRLDLIP